MSRIPALALSLALAACTAGPMHDTAPQTPSAAAMLPKPARANKPIFYERGKAKAVADVHKKFEDMMGLRLDRYNQVRDIAGAMAYSGD